MLLVWERFEASKNGVSAKAIPVVHAANDGIRAYVVGELANGGIECVYWTLGKKADSQRLKVFPKSVEEGKQHLQEIADAGE